MSNSSLVRTVIYSPNHSGQRGHSIDTITIHMVWGQLSAEGICNLFVPTSREASSNYVIGYDGKIGLSVDECNHPWTSGNYSNDDRAITIEVANDRTEPMAVNNAAYNALIKLCADICMRNGKKKMVWCGSLSATNNRQFSSTEMRMTLHKWFQDTSCPGTWLSSRMGDIATKVNALIETGSIPTDGSVYLVKGCVGDDVKTLQTNLNKVINAGLLVDGDFGSLTEQAVMDFQEKYGLFVDGIYGDISNAKMLEVIKTSASGATTTTKTETTTTFTKYLVKVTCDVLNVRSGPGTDYKINRTVNLGGIYTIVDQKDNWGKLKSGAGWICLDYTKKM